jgi:serine/threonine-protein kinase
MEPVPGAMVTPTVRLLSELGAGGMGRVWLADHMSLNARVVVKFLSPELAANPDARDRFAREASAAAQVRNPHVVQIFDHGIAPNGAPYIIMEHLEGRDLRAALTACRRLSVEDVALIVAQAAKALGRAHKRGIVHRDIKPDNIFLCDLGDELFVKVLDFGIAKPIHGDKNATSTGVIIGTLPYLSPEQLLGKKLDARTDLWSLGIVAFEALTGGGPYQAETAGALTLAVHKEGPPRISQYLPHFAALDAWFARACALDPEDRFVDATEMAEAFSASASGVSGRHPGASLRDLPAAAPSPTFRATFATASSKSSPVRAAAIVAAAVVVIGAVVAILVLRRPQAAPEPAAAAPPIATVTASATETVTPPTTTASTSSSIAPAPSAKPTTTAKPTTKPTTKKPGKKDAPIF